MVWSRGLFSRGYMGANAVTSLTSTRTRAMSMCTSRTSRIGCASRSTSCLQPLAKSWRLKVYRVAFVQLLRRQQLSAFCVSALSTVSQVFVNMSSSNSSNFWKSLLILCRQPRVKPRTCVLNTSCLSQTIKKSLILWSSAIMLSNDFRSSLYSPKRVSTLWWTKSCPMMPKRSSWGQQKSTKNMWNLSRQQPSPRRRRKQNQPQVGKKEMWRKRFARLRTWAEIFAHRPRV